MVINFCGNLISASFVRKQSPVLTVVCVRVPELALNCVFEVLSERAQYFSYRGKSRGPVNRKPLETALLILVPELTNISECANPDFSVRLRSVCFVHITAATCRFQSFLYSSCYKCFRTGEMFQTFHFWII